MPMNDVHASVGAFADKHTLARPTQSKEER